MEFFKAVFSDDTPPPSPPPPSTSHASGEHDPEDSDPNPSSSDSNNTAWNFGSFLETLASKSESIRHDLHEFSSELKKETSFIRQVASRAVDAGTSVAQESLESVGQAIDDIGASVWKSTVMIRDSLLALDSDNNSDYDNNYDRNVVGSSNSNQSLDVKKYSRFDALVRHIQNDVNTYVEEPEDVRNYNEWRLGFDVEKMGKEIEDLIEGNRVIEEIYGEVVPSRVDHEGFWSRYFYRMHKLKMVEDARAKLVKRAISGDEEEDLSWDFGDEDDDEGYEPRGDSSGVKLVKEGTLIENDVKDVASCSPEHVESNNSDSGRDSDISIISSLPSMPEEEDLGWHKVEDVGSNYENKVDDADGSASRIDLRKRLSSSEQEDDLSWDIEDDDDDDDAGKS